MNLLEERKLLDSVIEIAYEAGEKILEIYNSPTQVSYKDDNSPLTEADIVSHNLIVSKLEKLTPDIPIISEEGEEREIDSAHFWLVDPLDGTKEFIDRNGEFTINIALVENKLAKLGVIFAPALGQLYAGIAGSHAFKIDGGAEKTPIQVQPNVNEVIVVGSRRHGDVDQMNKILAQVNCNTIHPTGSSLKFCKIAEGTAHLYPRFGRTMEWDTAAGQAILMAAGGCVTTLTGETLSYGKKGFENPHFMALPSFDFLISNSM